MCCFYPTLIFHLTFVIAGHRVQEQGGGGSVEFTVVPKLNDVSWERSVLLYGMEFLYGNSREGEQQEKGEKMD